jgi:hypothetical protein
MKKLFDNLKILMNRYDLYQADDEVGLALNELETAVNTEPRVFLINYDKNSEAFDNIKNPSDEDFMDEAELQGTVFTLEGFVKHFNMSYSEINQETDSIRIIPVPVSFPV